MSLSPGTTVGRYQIQSLLGSGGMGDVYKALDATLGRPVALKVLRRELSVDPERLGRFLHEARAASALNHPNILTIHEVGDHDAARFLVSEFVEGETVRQRLERGSLTLREILDIGIQTASALSAAHAASIVHRDIKPDNLMLRPDGYVKVLDFGVATFARPAAGSTDAMVTMAATVETSPGTIIGTIAYMSPEQARGLAVDGRSDCYSLGVVLYELVTGRAPFVGADHQRPAGRHPGTRAALTQTRGARAAAAARMDHREGAREGSQPSLSVHRRSSSRPAAAEGRARIRPPDRSGVRHRGRRR